MFAIRFVETPVVRRFLLPQISSANAPAQPCTIAVVEMTSTSSSPLLILVGPNEDADAPSRTRIGDFPLINRASCSSAL